MGVGLRHVYIYLTIDNTQYVYTHTHTHTYNIYIFACVYSRQSIYVQSTYRQPGGTYQEQGICEQYIYEPTVQTKWAKKGTNQGKKRHLSEPSEVRAIEDVGRSFGDAITCA